MYTIIYRNKYKILIIGDCFKNYVFRIRIEYSDFKINGDVEEFTEMLIEKTPEIKNLIKIIDPREQEN